MENKLTLTVAGPDGSPAGAPWSDVVAAMGGLEDAVRLLTQHLGGRAKGPGRPPKWLRGQSALRILAVRPGSVMVDVAVDAPPDNQLYLEGIGEQALDTLCQWDGKEDSTLPRDVADTLFAAAGKLSEGAELWFGDAANPRRVKVQRKPAPVSSSKDVVEALLHGWLREVNWDKGTAQLHDYHGGYILLRFGPDLAEEMLRCATQYVEVKGRGKINKKGSWARVEVEQLNPTRSWQEPFDIKAFLDNPNPKIFDPDTIPRASEPFDVDEFMKIIREGRDV